jgi:hypothetical protein
LNRDADGYFFENRCRVPVKIGYYCKDASTGQYEAMGEVEMNSGEHRHAPCFLSRVNTDYAVCPQGDHFEGADGRPWRPEKVFACRNPSGELSDGAEARSQAASSQNAAKSPAPHLTSLAGSKWTCSSDAFSAVDWAWQFIDLYDYKLTFLSNSSAIHAIYNFVQGRIVVFHSTWNLSANTATEQLDGTFEFAGQATQEDFNNMQFGGELASSPPQALDTPATRKTFYTSVSISALSGYVVIPGGEGGDSGGADRKFTINCRRP